MKILFPLMIFLSFAAVSEPVPKALIGTWRLADVTCSKGPLSKTGEKYASRLKSKHLVVYYTISEGTGKMSSRNYPDPKNTAEFCAGTSEEKLIFGGKASEYEVVNTVLKYRKGGLVTPDCKGDFKNPDRRKQKYSIEGDTLRLQADYEWHPNKTKEEAKQRQACPQGEYVRIYKKSEKETFP